MNVEIEIGAGTEEVTDLELVFNQPFKCIGYNETYDCPEEAKYKIIRTCCRFIYFVCEDCMLKTMNYFKAHEGMYIECVRCNVTSRIDGELLKIERL